MAASKKKKEEPDLIPENTTQCELLLLQHSLEASSTDDLTKWTKRQVERVMVVEQFHKVKEAQMLKAEKE